MDSFLKLAVLGYPVSHSLSPVMHTAGLEALGLEGTYTAIEVKPSELSGTLKRLQDEGFTGVNLTVPLKEHAIPLLDEIDEEAGRFGAVNTVHFKDGHVVGYNTDGFGLLRSLQEDLDFVPKGKRILVLGAGGAARAAVFALAFAGAASISIVNRSADKARALAIENPVLRVGMDPEADLVINATSVGLKDSDPSLLRADEFNSHQKVYDLIYTRPVTPFLHPAIEAGATVANGLGMLLYQGARALEIWTGRLAPVEAMREALEAEVYDDDVE